MDVYVEKWAIVEVDTDDEELAMRLAAEFDDEGGTEFERVLSIDGCGTPRGKMDVALRLIATIPLLRMEDSKALQEAIRIAKRAIPQQYGMSKVSGPSSVVGRRRRTARPALR